MGLAEVIGFAKLQSLSMRAAKMSMIFTLVAGAFGGLQLAAGAAGCDPEAYPLEPTFCDDWCRVLLRARCDQEPENCVRLCEQSKAEGACFERQEALRACYQAAPSDGWVCTGTGFRTLPRPPEPLCRDERDALIACAYPPVATCLVTCRLVEADFNTDGGADAEAPDGATCPARDIPCDSICWSAGRYLDADASEEDLNALIRCALDSVDACYGRGDGGLGGDAQPTWSTVLPACAESLGE